MKKTVLFVIWSLFLGKMAFAQFVFMGNIEREHPRLISSKTNKENILKAIDGSEEIKQSYRTFKGKIAKYVTQYKSDPEWLSSRFQMYWKSHATNVYVDGEYYSHEDGQAPVPTVRFTGQRDYVTDYKTPKLEDVKPYWEDKKGIYLQNKNSGKWEWVHPSKTGRVIENINEKIMGIARDAALIYFIEGDVDYARLATHLFDVYMKGLYYRNEPIDLQNGNIQNVIGLTSFQVIKENIVDELAECYDFLYGYLQKNKQEELPIYLESLKKLAEIIIKNGVPDNNWNLHQANKVITIALVLDEDEMYSDGKGCQYYLNRVFNDSEPRQWSVNDVLAYGYDQENGIWNESSGYALSVAEGFTHLAGVIQDALAMDIMPQMPIIPKAVEVMPQYLFPNKHIVAFGDSHYGELKSQPFLDLIDNAQKFGKRAQEEKFTSLIYMLRQKERSVRPGKPKNVFKELLYPTNVNLDPGIGAANLSDQTTAAFYAPNVSWLVMRNGMDVNNGLMVSQVGALGNHTHSNGIAMELYGKGYVLAPEGGRGSSYFRPDYREYYSQFPAHNTVTVNGKSQYNKMRSYYPFEVNALYPASERKTGYYPHIAFSDIYFHEPSTDADQNRVMGIVRTGETSGFYIDIFRSKTKVGNADYHDYFYHNLGQDLQFATTDDQPLELETSSKLNSNSGNIKAYDYLYDETSVQTATAFKATYGLSINDGIIQMNMWMNGQENRELFKVKAPHSEAFRNILPEKIEKAPLLTTVVRQYGEAWNKPFVAVYEPSSSEEPSTIKSVKTFKTDDSESSFVGLQIDSKNNRTDHIFSSEVYNAYTHQNIGFTGTFGLLTKEAHGATLFIGAGKKMDYNGYTIEILGKKSSAATLVIGRQFKLTCNDPILLTVPDSYKKRDVVLHIGFKQIKGEREKVNGKNVVRFKVPPTEFQNISIKLKA
ncbi:heparinase II/III domain-containing protein [Maribacter polysaccharolyticus]|uniref:heparinase II/III domain-containing protein n=1 Tax=Maribacter polysaccharolyticus TaxID=3020831 RepID=UPI00237F818C|nr:heparinase II/III family protein [Maribacter polysaccharolyticus]MDE3740997.1 heparinase II/III family protein [Maribacter polysaccharolyticus]